MKKLKNIKARLLSLSLAFVMALSLAMGMAPMNVHATEGESTAATTTLTYEVVGGTGSMTQETLTVGERFTLPNPSFTPDDGRKFFGWLVYDSGDDGEMETGGYAGPAFVPKSDYTYKAIAYYGYSLTVENLPENTDVMYGSMEFGNPEAIVVPEFTEDMMEGNAFMIINDSITSAPSFTEQNGTATLLPSSTGRYMYCVQNITGPVTLTYNAAGDTPGGGTETGKIGSLADKVSVVNNASGDFTVTFNLDSNKSYVISTATAANFYEPEYFDDTYGPAKESVIGLANNVNVTPKSDLTQEKLASHWSNPHTSDLVITGAKNGLVSSYGPITVEDGTYIVIYEVKPEDKITYVDTDDKAPDNSGDYYIIYAAHAVFFPYGTGGNENPPVHQHSWSETWASDENSHWKTCNNGCSETDSRAPHTDENGDNKCDVCERAVTPADPETIEITVNDTNLKNGYVVFGLYPNGGGSPYYFSSEEEGPAILRNETDDVKLFVYADTGYEMADDLIPTATIGSETVGEFVYDEGECFYMCVIDREFTEDTEIVINGESEEIDYGSFEKDATLGTGSPITEAKLNNAEGTLIESLFDGADRDGILDGTLAAKVWLAVTKIDTVDPTEKTAIEGKATALGANSNITYFDASLFKLIGTNEANKESISNPGMDIEITIKIPTELLNTDSSKTRTYKMLRYHDGEGVTPIDGTFSNGEFTFKTNKFSTYAIIYTDTDAPGGGTGGTGGGGTGTGSGSSDSSSSSSSSTSTTTTSTTTATATQQLVKDDVPKTGEAVDYTVMVWTAILAIGVVGLLLEKQKRRQ